MSFSQAFNNPLDEAINESFNQAHTPPLIQALNQPFGQPRTQTRSLITWSQPG